MSPNEAVAIIDFGSQYTQLIARRVRESHVYCEILPHDAPPSHWERLEPKGCILSGGPASVYEEEAPRLPPYLLPEGKPILGICYGMQLLAQELGGRVAAAQRREYGPAGLRILELASPLFAGLPSPQRVWMSHGDRVEELPPGFRALAQTDNSPLAAMGDEGCRIYGLQFHPEVAHTLHGREIIANFLFRICGCQGGWNPGSFIEESTKNIREQIGKERVLCALSGGIDSLVTATLVGRAAGEQLTSIFVDHGLLRQGEAEVNRALFSRLGLKVIFVEAQERFLARLKGIQEPETKRQVIGEEFIRVFREEAERLGPFPFLAQGTLYPDLIESTSPHSGSAVRIKSHHNVAALPQEMAFSLVEPLRYLFKDEVREMGLALGLPEEIIRRQPFPGPGLAIRIIGEVTRERLQTLRAVDAIVEEEIKRAGLYRELWQSFAILTPVRSVGVMGDHRTYENVVVIRAVESEDGMTAHWAHLPYSILERMASRIVNEVAGVNRVVYDITSKPPATIEWE